LSLERNLLLICTSFWEYRKRSWWLCIPPHIYTNVIHQWSQYVCETISNWQNDLFCSVYRFYGITNQCCWSYLPIFI